MNSSHIPLPKSVKHQRFADLILLGATATEAYLAIGGKAASAHSVGTMASRLANRKDVADYIAAQRQAAASETTLTLREKREFLARIVRTPLLKIDTDSADYIDGDLIKKFKSKTDEMGTTVEIEKHDPLKAIEIDNRLDNTDPETAALSELTAALRLLAPSSPLPTGKL